METLRQIAILAYHKVGAPSHGAWETWFYVSESIFKAHLSCIREAAWTPIDALDFVAGLECPERLPERSVLITFDDGYVSVLRTAMPLLAEAGYPAVMFIPTKYIGNTNIFDDGVEPSEPICSWEELRKLQAGGISVQSHGASHTRLSTLSAEERDQEIATSRQVLENGLDKQVLLFSYPYGDCGSDPDASAASLRCHGYRAAFLYEGGVATVPAPQPFLLPRIPVGPDTNLRSILDTGVRSTEQRDDAGSGSLALAEHRAPGTKSRT
jgi:peptidoglycan/xylan/chitin deacetylase (PgdA/CDA1 family)